MKILHDVCEPPWSPLQTPGLQNPTKITFVLYDIPPFYSATAYSRAATVAAVFALLAAS